MKCRNVIAMVSALGMWVVGLSVGVPRAKGEQPGATTRVSVPSISYQAPPHLMKGARVTGGARGAASGQPELFILSPDHVGLTIQESPTIYYYLSKAAPCRFVLTITKDGVPDPILETNLDASKPGIGKYDLSKLSKDSLKLAPGETYQVSVALVLDPKRRSGDVFSSGMVQRVEPPDPLVRQLMSRPGAMERAVAYARQGIWYDALSILSDQIETEKDNPERRVELREQRAALLDQVNLPEAAAFDRTQ